MRKPNPDPHPERSADAFEDISPERVLWRQIDRFLEAQTLRYPEMIHGALSGLTAIVEKDDEYERDAESARDVNDQEERMLMLFGATVRRISRMGKWLKDTKPDVQPDREWRQSFG